MIINQLTKTERSLLLFLECAAVDVAGIYHSESLNAEDRQIMDRWKSEALIDHGRVASETNNPNGRVWVKLSPTAMAAAHEERSARADRMWRQRGWITTAEKRAKSAPIS